VPDDTKEVRAGEDDHDQSKDFVNLHQHQCFKYRVRFALDIVLDGCLQNFVIMVVDGLLDTINVEKLE
jgi:hypothetical protein